PELGGVLVEVAHQGVKSRRVEGLAPKCSEAGEQSASSGSALEGQSLPDRDLRVRSLTDLPLAEWTRQPADVLPPVSSAEDPDQPVDDPRADGPDRGGEPADAWRRGVRVSSDGDRRVQASIISRRAPSLSFGLCALVGGAASTGRPGRCGCLRSGSGSGVALFPAEDQRVLDGSGLAVGRWRESPGGDQLPPAAVHRQTLERRALDARRADRPVLVDDDPNGAGAREHRVLEQSPLVAAPQRRLLAPGALPAL